ncbi:hypothetical protein B5X24_HaOG209177 [Helicoverpa armigera]|nr:hypothetical protein B5X24_HaOG209177 [Helicoverpa armigera]
MVSAPPFSERVIALSHIFAIILGVPTSRPLRSGDAHSKLCVEITFSWIGHRECRFFITLSLIWQLRLDVPEP